MNGQIEFISEEDIIKIDDISNTFKYSLNINPKLKNEINNVYNKMLLNIGKANISLFNLKYINMFENLASKNIDNKEFRRTLKIHN